MPCGADGFEIEHRPPFAEQQAGAPAHEHVPILSDVNVGLLMLNAPDSEIGGDARFVAVDCKAPHIGD